MKIKLVMDKRTDSDIAWCGTYGGIFETIKTIVRGYKVGYRRFDFTRMSK